MLFSFRFYEQIFGKEDADEEVIAAAKAPWYMTISGFNKIRDRFRERGITLSEGKNKEYLLPER
jgi:hypothetical protein